MLKAVSMTGTILRREYEKIVGQVSDSTWQRILGRLSLGDANIKAQTILLVRAYAQLRLLNPNRIVRLEDVQRYEFICSNLPQLSCNGAQLFEALQRLEPKPSKATVYRWGQEIGVAFSVNKVYTESELQQWVIKIASQTKFKFRQPKSIKAVS
jgi:hypothetical protein